MSPEEVYKLLGDDVVLIPLGWGTKIPIAQGWPNLKPEDTKAESYQKMLRGKNLGVVVGKPSNGLITVDVDVDERIEEFLEDNPMMRDTLRTSADRGANFWFRVTGEIPRVRPNLHK